MTLGCCSQVQVVGGCWGGVMTLRLTEGWLPQTCFQVLTGPYPKNPRTPGFVASQEHGQCLVSFWDSFEASQKKLFHFEPH